MLTNTMIVLFAALLRYPSWALWRAEGGEKVEIIHHNGKEAQQSSAGLMIFTS